MTWLGAWFVVSMALTLSFFGGLARSAPAIVDEPGPPVAHPWRPLRWQMNQKGWLLL